METILQPSVLHEVIGGEPNRAKVLDHLETHSMRWAGESPLVAFASARSTTPSIHLVNTRDRVSTDRSSVTIRLDGGDLLARTDGEPLPVGSLWLLPAIEETLRINGRASRVGDGLRVDVDEMYMHCAKAFKRSRLWEGPLAVDPGAGEREFIESSPFALLATVDESGQADISPRGDPAGEFCRLSDDESVLVIPDRPGNKIADSMHNVLSNPRASVMFLVPGSSRVLQATGTVVISTNSEHREAAAVRGRVPKVVLELNIETMDLTDSSALQTSRVWDRSTYIPKEERTSMAHIVADQMFGEGSEKAAAMRAPIEDGVRHDYETNMY